MRRSVGVAEQVGIRSLVVHSISKQASAFYKRYGLSLAPSDAQHLMIIVKDIRAALEQLHA